MMVAKIYLEVLTELYDFNTPEYGNSRFRYTTCRSVCRYVYMCICLELCMYLSLAPEWLDGFYSYSVIKGLSILGGCQVNLNILDPKIRANQMGHQTQNCDFL
jgi:hypothetical protein